MSDTILIARDASVAEVPAANWLAELDGAPDAGAERLAFMTPEHHRVRYFVVREMTAGGGRPLPPDRIAARLDLPSETVVRLLDELEKHLFFLVRNEAGEVSWAYPVTSDVTPHRLSFRSGERLYAA